MNNEITKAERIVQKMYDGDLFSQWLGIKVLEIKPGYSKLKMTAREEMTNGFHVLHGGITYSLADSALAFACNGHGKHGLSIHTEINHTRPVFPGDTLIAEATENHCGRSSALYTIEIKNQDKKLVAHFKGTVFRKDTDWELNEPA